MDCPYRSDLLFRILIYMVLFVEVFHRGLGGDAVELASQLNLAGPIGMVMVSLQVLERFLDSETHSNGRISIHPLAAVMTATAVTLGPLMEELFFAGSCIQFWREGGLPRAYLQPRRIWADSARSWRLLGAGLDYLFCEWC
jgi:hypothetical protein